MALLRRAPRERVHHLERQDGANAQSSVRFEEERLIASGTPGGRVEGEQASNKEQS